MTVPTRQSQGPSGDPQTPAQERLRTCRTILCVCLGNICRSPLAQGVLEHELRIRGAAGHVAVASCGTGDWHVGDLPDHRSIAVARSHGIELRSRGRVLDPSKDFQEFDLILAMDQQNLRNLHRAGCPPDKATLMLAFAPSTLARPHNFEIPDPYHGGPEDFDQVFELINASARGLLDVMLSR